MQLHLALLSFPGGNQSLIVPHLQCTSRVRVCANEPTCVYIYDTVVHQSVFLCVAKFCMREEKKKVLAKSQKRHKKRKRSALWAFKFSPSDTEGPAILAALPVCKTPLLLSALRVVVNKCEKLQLNEGFTSYWQCWRWNCWLGILVAYGYHYVMGQPFLLAAMFSNCALINVLKKKGI